MEVFWDELRGRSFLNCLALAKQGKPATHAVCFEKDFKKQFITKRKTY